MVVTIAVPFWALPLSSKPMAAPGGIHRFPIERSCVGGLSRLQAREYRAALVLQRFDRELRKVEELDYSQGIARTGVALLELALKDTIMETNPALGPCAPAMTGWLRRDFPERVGLMALDDRLIDISGDCCLGMAGALCTEPDSQCREVKDESGDISDLSRVELDGEQR